MNGKPVGFYSGDAFSCLPPHIRIPVFSAR